MQRSFTLLPLVDRLHCRLVSGLSAIYSKSWVTHSSMIRVATLFLPDYGHYCRMRVLLGGSLGVLLVLYICTGIWVVKRPGLMQRSLLAWIYLYFLIFAPPVRPGTEAYKPYIQQFPKLGYKNENKLLDIRLRLDVTTADEVRWCIPAHPIQSRKPLSPPNNRMYVLRNTFVEALWLEDTESREYSQWLSLTSSSRYATPGSVRFDAREATREDLQDINLGYTV
ncbi:hypothetical protein M9H77_32279 [Catharanthus roseus]|uniref:Uncharacterized protein n=1 Tax=Catharanthus roseus TaxID=4058 RepID=A0ACC0A2I2_CATRO|nr:hypothetical protein M9H77_32279 [Catharanthus roseus]